MTARNPAEADPRQNSQRRFGRRGLLKGALGAAALLLGIGSDKSRNPLRPQSKERKNNLLGGIWKFPLQDALIPQVTEFSVRAYRAGDNGSRVDHVTFTINPKNLPNPQFNSPFDQGSWVVLGKADRSESGNIYRLNVDLRKIGANPGTQQQVSFDVHGYDSNDNPIVHEAPNGIHRVKIL